MEYRLNLKLVFLRYYRYLCSAAGLRVGEACRGVNLAPAIIDFPLDA